MLPIMRSKNSKKKYVITAFGGVNGSYSRAVNEFKSAYNMSSSLYPALHTAPGYKKEITPAHNVVAAIYRDGLYTVEEDAAGGNVYVGNNGKNVKIGTYSENYPQRSIACLQKEMLIVPDNCVYNMNTDTAYSGCAAHTFSQQTAQSRYDSIVPSGKIPIPYNTWYSSTLTGNSITSIQASYTYSGLRYDFYHFVVPPEFVEGDVVNIKMDVTPFNATQDDAYYRYITRMKEGMTLRIKSVIKTSHTTPGGIITENTALVFDDNVIDMGGYTSVFVSNITIEKGIPNLVDICSFENRIWGITKNELRCSKLGDCTQWYDFTVDDYGTLPSSCFCTVAESDGEFTAIAAYNGNVYAFKEDCIHKIYGKEPSEYTVMKINSPGVASNCKRSLVHVAGYIYYMGKNGIYRYDGSSVKLISRNLNISGMSCACAGGDERFYYIELHNDTNSYIYVFDTLYGIWNITAAPKAITDIILAHDGMRFVCTNGIYSLSSDSLVGWNFTYSFGAKEFSSKHVCCISMRYTVKNEGSVYIDYKSKVMEKRIYFQKGDGTEKIVTINLPPYCSEDCELTIRGTNEIIITSLHITYKETGIND